MKQFHCDLYVVFLDKLVKCAVEQNTGSFYDCLFDAEN